MMRQEEISQVHQAGDRQPALDASRGLQGGWCTARLKLPHPKIEDSTEPRIQQQKCALEAAAHDLRIITIGAANELFLRLRGEFRPLHNRRNQRAGWNLRDDYILNCCCHDAILIASG